MRFHAYSRCLPAKRGASGGGRMHRHFGLFGARRRFFGQGDVRLIILKLIGEKPSHGYEIIKAIEDRLGGAYSPSPGIVYPALTLLEEQGLIRVETTDGPRKLYAITPEGEDGARTQSRDGRRDFCPHRGDQCAPRRRPGAANRSRDGKSQTRFAVAPRARPARRGADRKNLGYSRRSRKKRGGKLTGAAGYATQRPVTRSVPFL